MKQVTVRSKTQGWTMVEIRGRDTDELTPSMARAAVEIAFGLSASAVVRDGRKVYRVTPKTTKKLNAWEF